MDKLQPADDVTAPAIKLPSVGGQFVLIVMAWAIQQETVFAQCIVRSARAVNTWLRHAVVLGIGKEQIPQKIPYPHDPSLNMENLAITLLTTHLISICCLQILTNPRGILEINPQTPMPRMIRMSKMWINRTPHGRF